MNLELHIGQDLIWHGWVRAAADLLAIFPRPEEIPAGDWRITVRPAVRVPAKNRARAALLALAGLENLQLIGDEGIPFTVEALTLLLAANDPGTLPQVFSFCVAGVARFETLLVIAALFAEAESARPARLWGHFEMEALLSPLPHGPALLGALTHLDELLATGTLGFRRIGRPQVSPPGNQREKARRRLNAFRERQLRANREKRNGS